MPKTEVSFPFLKIWSLYLAIPGQAIPSAIGHFRLAETPYIKLVKKEKLALHIRGNDQAYNELYTSDEIDRLFHEVVSYYIDPGNCQACMTCAKRCPAEAIISAKKHIHVVDQEKCIKCGTCFEACPPRFGAVAKISGRPVPLPVPELHSY